MKRNIDCQPGDHEFVAKFDEEVDTLIGLVLEMFEDKPALLLSPVFRDLLVKQAKKARAYHGPLRLRHVVDNPGPPLTPEDPTGDAA